MSKFEITQDDIRHINWFEPQRALEQLNQAIQKKLADHMGFCEHEKEHVKIRKVGEILDERSRAEFRPNETYRFVCEKCGKFLEPIGYK